MNLFTIDLECELTYQAIEEFLRVGDREEDCPQEDMFLDFSENILQDLGEVVTAFADTYGGIIVIGGSSKEICAPGCQGGWP